jgi:hypothetical protein
MKLHSVLPGWMKILTRPCVCPQVLHGSMRLMGGDREVTTVRGMKLPGNVANLAASRPGDALESEGMVKLINAFKHRHRNRAIRGCLRLGPKWQAVETGLSNVTRRTLTRLPV